MVQAGLLGRRAVSCGREFPVHGQDRASGRDRAEGPGPHRRPEDRRLLDRGGTANAEGVVPALRALRAEPMTVRWTAYAQPLGDTAPP